MKPRPARSRRFAPKEADIIIHPGGETAISFLWDDLRGLAAPAGRPAEKKSRVSRSGSRKYAANPAIPEAYRACRLCPKLCGADRVRGGASPCGDHWLRLGTYGISFGDEPALRGVRGSGAILLSGCPLSCPDCHNAEMVRRGAKLSEAGLWEICWSLRAAGAGNIQLLSPTVHLPRLARVLRQLKEHGFDLPLVLKSSGYEWPAALRKLSGLVDVYVPDLKFGPWSQAARRAGAPGYFSAWRAALREMHRQTGPAVVDREGLLRRGVLVRRVESPLPARERGRLNAALRGLPQGLLVSRLNSYQQIV